MARLARVVAAGLPHHVTQRGNRRQKVFFGEGDYEIYRGLLAEGCRAAGVAVWAYCLMPNHVHLILVPSDADGLRAALGEAHRRYTRQVNLREGWRGYLWQGRFASFPMDESHLLACARYVLGWSPQASWLSGVALSTTSVAVVYAVMLELGLNGTGFGKAVLAYPNASSRDPTMTSNVPGARILPTMLWSHTSV